MSEEERDEPIAGSDVPESEAEPVIRITKFNAIAITVILSLMSALGASTISHFSFSTRMSVDEQRISENEKDLETLTDLVNRQIEAQDSFRREFRDGLTRLEVQFGVLKATIEAKKRG